MQSTRIGSPDEGSDSQKSQRHSQARSEPIVTVEFAQYDHKRQEQPASNAKIYPDVNGISPQAAYDNAPTIDELKKLLPKFAVDEF